MESRVRESRLKKTKDRKSETNKKTHARLYSLRAPQRLSFLAKRRQCLLQLVRPEIARHNTAP